MNTREAIKKRRAIKEFDPRHQMSAEEERELLSLTMLSPTAFNLQHWRFVLVKDPALRAQIRAVSWDQTQVTDSSLLVILCADTRAWKKDPVQYWVNAPLEVRENVVPAIDAFYRGNEQAQRDEVMRSCGIAAQTLMLAAQDMGYDSCPMDGFDFDKVAQLINLPEDHIISLFVAIGKGTQDAFPRSGQLEMEKIVISNQFQG
jgi:nitroreductase